jgi:hypothetical protein
MRVQRKRKFSIYMEDGNVSAIAGPVRSPDLVRFHKLLSVMVGLLRSDQFVFLPVVSVQSGK